MKDYSQSGEQAVILNYFTGRERGTLLDIGANDGETFSMSRALMLDGWSGVLIEPSPAAFSKLLDTYRVTGSGRKPDSFVGTPGEYHAHISGGMVVAPGGNARLVNAAITPTDGPAGFYDSGTHLKKGDVALLSTTVPAEMDRWKKSGEQFTKTTVRGITFATLMRERGVKHFDFISIDAEGCDLSILKQIDLTAVGCQMLCIEFNQNKTAEAEMRAYCAKHGLSLHYRTYENLLFAKQ